MFNKAKAIIREDVYTKFYDESKPLYIETNVSGVGLGAALLQTRSNTNCHRDEAPDKSIHGSIAFTSKSLTWADKRYINIIREALGILYGLKIPSFLLCERGKYHHRSQTTHCHFQKRCSYIITEATADPTKKISIQGENHIHAWTRPIHAD